MACYILADIEVTDPDEYQKYVQQVPATVEQYGGTYLVRGGQPETLEGNWKASRIVILEFPSVEQAKAWYEAPEYSAITGLRQRASTGSLLLVQGV
jgi:uncharacterized protein (DUF1330 family)